MMWEEVCLSSGASFRSQGSFLGGYKNASAFEGKKNKNQTYVRVKVEEGLRQEEKKIKAPQ